MSARMLQRALQNNQAEASHVKTVSSDVDRSDSEADEGRRSVGNPFNLLGLEDEDENEEGDDERDSNQQSVAGSASTSAPVAVGPSKSKRKKNKGKKKGRKEPNSSERPASADADDDVKVSVDKLLERLEVGNGEGPSSTLGGSPSQDDKSLRQNAREVRNVLAVDTKHLKAADELRRIFGSKVINSVERTGEGAGAQRRRQGVKGRRLGRGKPLRKSLLVVPMEHWAGWDGGITMECIKVESGIQYFRYQYSASYQDVQKRFELCVSSHDPNSIVMLLRSHPYHVDSLLALAEVYKQMGNHQQAASLLEQCLYALECAWHPWFNPSLGTCRLEFSWDTNKAFFVCLFRHMQHLGRRGCHRTALEVCKLLLSLDAIDPLGALFCIDYFALRAEQYEWLERFVDEYESSNCTSLLPNFSFSAAVACFHRENQQSHQSNRSDKNVKGSKDLTGSKMSSAILLQQALLLHPSVLKKIIVKAMIKEDQPWTKIVSHSQFCQASGGGPTLEHLIDIYVERNYLIWRSPELQGWLKEAATEVTQIADKSGSDLANWDCVRTEVFPSSENEYKHLHVSEFSDSTSTLPPEDMPQLGLHPNRDLGFAGNDLVGEVGEPLEEAQLQQAVHQAALQGRNALLVFLQSFAPWMDYGGEASVEDAPALLGDGSDDNDSIAGDDGEPFG